MFVHSFSEISKKSVKLPEPVLISGAWKMKLEGFGFDTFETNTNKLISWTDSPRTEHFSGTGRYETEFSLTSNQVTADAQMILDLGKVGDVADVELNGKNIGVAWMWPYRLDITDVVRPGKNKLVVLVTNQLVNYVSGLKEAPDVPLELQPRLGKADPTVYKQSNIAKKDMSQTDLPPSGLMGPVQIVWKEKL